MKIYRIAQDDDEKSVRWDCPTTGMYIIAHFYHGDTAGYELYASDGSFFDIFDNFWHARNWAKKHVNKDCNISGSGRRIDEDI